LRVILLMSLAVVLMVLDHRNQHLIQIRSWLAASLYPLQQAVDAPFSAVQWARNNLAARSQLTAENARLKAQLLVQSARLQRLAALEAENERVRALLDSTTKVGDNVLIAEIIAVDTDRFRHRVVINRGSRDGAFVGQALIDAKGVVGQIIRDRGASAEALLITDPDHAVPTQIVRTGLRTIAVGSGEFDRLSLPFVARNSDVKAGDLLVTSGLGGTFPAGYPVGTISEVRGDSGESFLTVSARPAAAVDRLREVLLVIPQPQPAGTPAADTEVKAPVQEPAIVATPQSAPAAATGNADAVAEADSTPPQNPPAPAAEAPVSDEGPTE
jgi:rod shape-determining protein MreC